MESNTSSDESVSSGIGAQMIIARDLQGQDPDGTATTSEIAREELGDYLGEVKPAAVTLTREQYDQATCEEYGNRRSQQHSVHTISSDDSSLLSPPLTTTGTTDYGGSHISFPKKTQSTEYEVSLLALPLSALPQDPCSTARASTGIIARKYIQAE